jgi:hypothetical protein
MRQPPPRKATTGSVPQPDTTRDAEGPNGIIVHMHSHYVHSGAAPLVFVLHVDRCASSTSTDVRMQGMGIFKSKKLSLKQHSKGRTPRGNHAGAGRKRHEHGVDRLPVKGLQGL